MASLSWRSNLARGTNFSRCTHSIYSGRRSFTLFSKLLRQDPLDKSDININESSTENRNLEGEEPSISSHNADEVTTPKLSNSIADSKPSASKKPTSGLSALRRLKVPLNKEEIYDERPKPLRTIFGQTTDKPVRTRFAPSPTGYLHLGSLRTALFCNLASTASTGGSFILRIEDTDQSRLVHDAEQRIIQDLKWLGLKWDEGPDCGGPHGPYRQSERLEIYKDHVQRLIDEGHAYRCFCKPDDLEEQKKLLHEAGKPTIYSGACRSVHTDESSNRAASGESHVVRFKGDAFGNLGMRDAIYGQFQKKDKEEDFIIMKTDGYPTYHLANVVDDHLMDITHVIRGEEWLISTPKHLALYKAFGWEPPTFAHLGLLVNDDGSKLSKRQNSANLESYKENGISPMAMQAWLANLGSSFSSDRKWKEFPRVLADTADALTFKFTKGGIKLNPEKLSNFELQYRSLLMYAPHNKSPSPHLGGKVYTKDEIEWFQRNVYTPILKHIKILRLSPESLGDYPDKAWRGSKDEIPNTTVADKVARIRRAYKHGLDGVGKKEKFSVFSGKPEDAAKHLILNHPYLFWRVPMELYRRGLYSHRHELHALEFLYDRFEAICEEPAVWKRMTSPLNHEELLHKIGLGNRNFTYEAHRLVATGLPQVPSASMGNLCWALGREESKYRFGVVKNLVKELRDGGEEIREQWLLEIKNSPSYPDIKEQYYGNSRTKSRPVSST